MPSTRLRMAREIRGWSQARVAESLGVSIRTIIRWEQGDALPYPHYREQLAALFGMSSQQLGLLPDLESEHLPQPPTTPASEGLLAPLARTTPQLCDPLIPFTLTQASRLLGREALLTQIKERLFDEATVALTALNGLPGIGKTALAAALALNPEVQQHFADGILWAALGPNPNMLSMLTRWGSLLNISPDEVEDTQQVHAWSRALRATIGKRRMLLVIDDAWSSEAALALYIGGPHCAHLITTRQPQVVAAFAAQETITVNELSEADGLTLLARYVPELVRSEPALTGRLVQAVGALPLALTLMGTTLAQQAATGQPRRLQQTLHRLLDPHQRLTLNVPLRLIERPRSLSDNSSLSLQNTIAISIEHLSEPAQQALFALAIYPAKPSSFSEEAALAITQAPVEMLDVLWDMGLLESSGSGRYTLHQTIADVARENLASELRTATEKQLVSFWIPELTPHVQDYNWLDQEWANAQLALDIALHAPSCPAELLPTLSALQPYMHARGMLELARQYVQRALDLAQQQNDPALQAALWRDLADIADKRGDYPLLEQAVAQGLPLVQPQQGMVRGDLLSVLARYKTLQGQMAEAQTLLQQALESVRPLQDWHRVSRALRDLGTTYRLSGAYDQASTLLEEGFTISRQHRLHEQSCLLLHALAGLTWEQGELARARELVQQGLTLAQQHGYRSSQAKLLEMRGILEATQGDSAEANRSFEQALVLFQTMGNRASTCLLLANLAENTNLLHNYEQGAIYAREALQLARQMNSTEDTVPPLSSLGVALGHLGQEQESTACFQEGLQKARESQNIWLTAMLLYEWGQIELLQKRIDEASEHFHELLAQNEPPGGSPLWRTRARWGLACVAHARGELIEARRLADLSLEEALATQDALAEQVRPWLDKLQAQDNASDQ